MEIKRVLELTPKQVQDILKAITFTAQKLLEQGDIGYDLDLTDLLSLKEAIDS